VSERATRLVDNMVRALDIVAPRKQFRILIVWEGKRWFSEEVREAPLRKDITYRRALYERSELS